MKKNNINLLIIVFVHYLFCSSLTAQTWDSVQQFGGHAGESCQALTVDQEDHIYMSGSFNGQFQLGNTTLSTHSGIDIYLTKLSPSGEVQWVVSGGSVENEEVANLAVDSDHHVYWTGMYWLQADFGDTILNVESSSRAIFIIKYTPDGRMLWAKSFDGTGLKQIKDVTTDSNNHLYLTGYFEQTLTLDNISMTAKGDTDMFVAKMSPDGSVLWANHAGISGQTLGISIAVDLEKNVVVGGHYQGRVSFDQDTIQSNTPDLDVFIAKFDDNGQAIWGKKAGGAFPSENCSVGIGPDNDVYVTGTFLGVLKLSDDIELQTSGFNKNVFLLRYQPDGTPIWAKSIGGLGDEEVQDMYLRNDRIAISGNFTGDMVVDDFSIHQSATIFNGFVAGFSLDGTAKWLQKMSSSDLLLGEEVVINHQAQVIAAGNFTQTASFDQVDYVSQGSFDIFLAQLNEQITPLSSIQAPSAPFHLFPNPTNDQVFIKTHLKDFIVEIYHLDGRRLKTYTNTKQLYVNDLPKGIYCVRMSTLNLHYCEKLVVF